MRAGRLLAAVLFVLAGLAWPVAAQLSVAVDCGIASTLALGAASSAATVAVGPVGVTPTATVLVAPGQSSLLFPCAGELEVTSASDAANVKVAVVPDDRGFRFWMMGAGLVVGGLFAMVLVRSTSA